MPSHNTDPIIQHVHWWQRNEIIQVTRDTLEERRREKIRRLSDHDSKYETQSICDRCAYLRLCDSIKKCRVPLLHFEMHAYRAVI